MDLLPEYEVYPTYELADYVIPENQNVQFEGYFCPDVSCEDTSISESNVSG